MTTPAPPEAPGIDTVRRLGLHVCEFTGVPGQPEPGPCECGRTYAQAEADRHFTTAAAMVAAAYPLPDADYLTGIQDTWHAVSHADADWSIRRSGRHITTAVCGRPTRLALKYPVYRRGRRPVSYKPCPECAWTVATARGEIDVEVARLMPGGEDRQVLARLIPDPLIAVTAAAMIVEAAAGGHGDYELDHPSTIALLAAVERHAPVILTPEDCADGDCEHGDGGECPRPHANAACEACSLQVGPWAGEWEGTFRHECTVPAPCPPLIQLAGYARKALEEAKQAAQAAADWEREQQQEVGRG